MIYTVTFNPAIDYVVGCEKLCAGEINRADREEIFFGGKGINVSLVLNELGVKSKALGFVAGFTGKAIEDGVRAQGVETDFVHLDSGFSRICVKIKADEETEINGAGPKISHSAIQSLFDKLSLLKSGDTLILAGSIPKSLPNDIYERILASIDGKGVRTVVDAAGDLLLKVLKYKPFMVKPNNFELGDMFGVKLESIDDVIKYAEKLKEMGAENVLVSMAADGSVLVDENGEIHRCGVCNGTVINSVGAGDSMVAGFVAGCEKGYDYALKLGTAAGGATAFSSGLAKGKDIIALLETL